MYDFFCHHQLKLWKWRSEKWQHLSGYLHQDNKRPFIFCFTPHPVFLPVQKMAPTDRIQPAGLNFLNRENHGKN